MTDKKRSRSKKHIQSTLKALNSDETPEPTYSTHDGNQVSKSDGSQPMENGQVVSSSERRRAHRGTAPQLRSEIRSFRDWQLRTRTHQPPGDSLVRAASYIAKLSTALELPRATTVLAFEIFTKAFEKGITSNRSTQAMAAAVTYAACRIKQTPRFLLEVAGHAKVEKTQLSHCYRLLLVKLELKVPLADMSTYVSRICDKLELAPEVQTKALDLLKMAEEAKLLTGRDPWGLSAAAIYLSSILEGYQIGQREIAAVAGVSVVTVRNRYKDMKEKLGIDRF